MYHDTCKAAAVWPGFFSHRYLISRLGLWGGIFASTDREKSSDQYPLLVGRSTTECSPMSGLSVLKVYGSLPDLFKMFNSTIGTFHHTEADALQRSSLAGIQQQHNSSAISASGQRTRSTLLSTTASTSKHQFNLCLQVKPVTPP